MAIFKIHFWQVSRLILVRNNIFHGTQWLFIFAVFLAIDWLLYTKMSSLFYAINCDEYNLSELRGIPSKRVTINHLIANTTVPMAILKRKENWTAEEDFTLQKLECNNLVLIKGAGRNRFRICYPPKLLFREHNRLAYFINGQRDHEFEWNFKRNLVGGTKLKVFTRWAMVNASKNCRHGPDLVEDVHVKIYAEEEEEEDEAGGAGRMMGIKDLIDAHDDYRRMEFIKFEMHTKADPILFSVNIPIFAVHLLLRLENFSSVELHKLIRRLENALYFPYAIDYDRQMGVHFMSLMHKYSFYKYSLNGINQMRDNDS